jgi:radical SAM protein with 4Fe4S-binding SPASM domain
MSIKVTKSDKYNYIFNSVTGFFARWGETKEDDPTMSPFGPEIADIEISTVCNGIGKSDATRKPCPWCYKSNTGCGSNMTFDTFVDLFHKLPRNLTQIAFGIGDVNGNPDLWRIMEYCRSNSHNSIVPNITVNGMGVDKEVAKKLTELCGAVSVSRYHIPDVCYDAIGNLTEAGLKQVNIHQLLAAETYDSCFKLLNDVKDDERLSGLNAIVFLMLKPKGDRNKYKPVESIEKFNKLIKLAQEKGVPVGMDSCTAPLMFKFADTYNQQEIIPSIEPCESTLFSVYINTDAEVFPCSFTEGQPGWETGMSMLGIDDFMKDIWFSDRLSEWRNGLLESSSVCSSCNVQEHCRSCPVFEITPCREGYENPNIKYSLPIIG